MDAPGEVLQRSQDEFGESITKLEDEISWSTRMNEELVILSEYREKAASLLRSELEKLNWPASISEIADVSKRISLLQ